MQVPAIRPLFVHLPFEGCKDKAFFLTLNQLFKHVFKNITQGSGKGTLCIYVFCYT